MSEIKKIRAYIAQNPLPRPDQEKMTLTEAAELSRALDMTYADVLMLAYEYGRSRGYHTAMAERDKEPGPVYSVTEAAKAMKMSRQSMYALIHREGFPTLKAGGRRLISRELLAEWVRKEASKSPAGAAGGINTPVQKEIRSQL